MTLAPGISTIQIGKEWFPERPGGLDRYYYDLIRHLPPSGISVSGFVAGSERVASESQGRVRSFAPSSASLVRRWRGVRRHVAHAIAEQPHSLLVTHFALYARPWLDLLGTRPLMVHFQGPWSDESRMEGASPMVTRIKRRVEQAVYDRASRFIVLSRAFRQVLEQRHQVPVERIDVIPGGVDCARWRPVVSKAEARRELGWSEDRPVVLVVRRLVRRMGLEGLIESAAHLRRQLPDAQIIIAGKGPLARELSRRVRESHTEHQIRLAGFIPDEQLPTAYRAADLSVVPSVALEGFGLVAAESLAAGTPVLVTAVGGLPETVSALAPQCVIEGREPAQIGAAICDALLGRFPLPDAAQCIAYAHAAFDWSGVATQVGASYREALS